MRLILATFSTSLLGLISGLFTQLIFIRELAHVVPNDEFALYTFAFQIISYLNILQLGLDFATSREIALKLGQNDFTGAKESYKFIRTFNYKICVIGFILVFICSGLFFNGIGIHDEFDKDIAGKLVLLFGASIFINFISNPSIVALIGSNKQAKVNINNILITIATSVVAFILLKTTSLGVYSMPLSLILFNAFNIYLLKRKAYKYCEDWLIGNSSIVVTQGYNKSILKFSFLTTIGGLAWTIEATSDIFILNGVSQLSLIAFYVLWWRFPQMSFDLVTRLTSSSLPSLNTSFGRSDSDAKLIFNRVVLLVGGLGFCVYISIASWLPAFINIWVGPQFFIDDMKLVSYLIGLLVYSRVIGNCFSMFTITIGKINYSTTLSWIQAIVKVIIAIYLLKQLGFKGLFISSLAGSLIQVSGNAFLLFKRKLLRSDVALLVLIGYLVPLILLLFNLQNKISLFKFLQVSSATLVCAILLWILIIQIISLNTKLNFSLSYKNLMLNLKKTKLNV